MMRTQRGIGLVVVVLACGDGGAVDATGSTGADGTTGGSGSTMVTPTSGEGSVGEGSVGEVSVGEVSETGGDPTTGGETTGDDTTGGEPGCAPALPSFADGLTPTATLYVQGGAQPGGDGSVEEPFDGLQAALAVVTPGTEVRVSGAVAGAYTTGIKGTAGAPIWISGEPGAVSGPLTLEGASYVVVRGLELANSADGHVLHFFAADHLLLRGLKIHDAGLGAIKGSQSTEVVVEGCELWAAGKVNGHPVLDYVGVNGGRIVHSKFHDTPGVMIMLKGGTSDLLFAWNEIFNQTMPGNALSLGQSTGPEFFQPIDAAFEGLRIVAYANLLHDLVGAPVAFEGCKDCAAVHNTIWNTTGPQLVRFLPGAAGMNSGVVQSLSEGCRFSGNIVVGGQEGGASLNADDGLVGPNNVIDYNVFLKPGGLNWWGVIPQDMVYSTYDQDPQVGAGGVPGNVALVDGKGPPDLGGLPFAEFFTMDAAGACVQAPTDIGAIAVP